MDNYLPTISFRLINSELLESGYVPNSQFTQLGGTIGSSQQSHWVIQDTQSSIAATQCAIVWQDKQFCLKTLSEPIYINNALIPIDIGAVCLSQSDQVKIGQLVLSVNINLTQNDKSDLMAMTPQSLIVTDDNPLDPLLQKNTSSAHKAENYMPLAPTVSGAMTHDPLKALERESLELIQSSYSNSHHHSLSSPHSDNQGAFMVQEFMDLPEMTYQDNEINADVDYVAINPLMKGLGVHLNLQNSQQANDFLIELGKTTQSAIKGLLALQQQGNLQDKQLRPIEDNPLRLNNQYDNVMRLMFTDDRSPVHLSAPSAVAESLHNVQLHYHANQEAISAALATLLDAFSPEHLLKRFSHYRRSYDNNPNDSAWAWDMYTNYYNELASSRQKGFEKLFYEVYTHAYDRALRKGLDEV